MKTNEKFEQLFDSIIEKVSTSSWKDWIKEWISWWTYNYTTKKHYRWFNSFSTSLFSWWSWAFITDNQAVMIFWPLLWKKKNDKWMYEFKDFKEMTIKVVWTKSVPIFFYSPLDKTNKWDDEKVGDEIWIYSDKPSFIWKYSNVFPIEWYKVFESIKDKLSFPKEKVNNKKIDIEDLISKYLKKEKIKIVESSSCYFSPKEDCVGMPSINKFSNTNTYYHSYFHELIHSTGTKNREDRKIENRFGDKDYSNEELVAELGSIILSNECWNLNDEILQNSGEYLKNWLNSMKEKDERNTLHKTFWKSIKGSEFVLNYKLYKDE